MPNKEQLRAYHAAWYQANKARCVRLVATYRKNNKRKVMGHKLWQKYRLPLEAWDKMLIDQCGLCGICSKPMTGPKDPAVDHDHKTGKIRGLTHDNCNRAIGLMGDDPEALLSGAKYLLDHKETR
jgi:5-methylcytosine-specific restriction endonuclease McrA